MSHVDDGTLHALVDNALPDAERAAVEAHLATCGECAKQFADATAMARQVQTLLGALDEVPAPVRVEKSVGIPHKAFNAPTPVRTAALANINLSPMQRRMRTLRRVALAASVLVVAGVSYRVGVNRTMASDAAKAVSAPHAAPAARPMAPSVVMAAPEAIPAPSAPTTRVPQPSGPRAADEMAAPMTAPVAPAPSPAPQLAAVPPVTADVQKTVVAAENVVTCAATAESQQSRSAAGVAMRRAVPAQAAAQTQDASAPRQEGRALSQVVVTGMPSASQAVVTSAPAPAAPPAAVVMPKTAPATIAGYQIVDEVPTPAVTRRRYIASEGGVMLTLLIAPAGGDASKPTAKRSELTVSSGKDGSVVRWHRDGLSYELQGPLPPDSLVKLATQLK